MLGQAVHSLQHQAREVPREIVEDGVANSGHVPASTAGHDDVATVHEMVTRATSASQALVLANHNCPDLISEERDLYE